MLVKFSCVYILNAFPSQAARMCEVCVSLQKEAS